MLAEYLPGDRVRAVAYPDYTGYRPPILNEIQGIYGDTNNSFAAYQSHDIDSVGYESLSTADLELIFNDPTLSANWFQTPGDFRTDYLLFDTYNPPFNDQKVRLAFAKALDRENIVKNVIGDRIALPAYTFLMPGFPASDTEGALKDIQAYDCDAAKALLAEAGYPDGEGFPAVTLQLRGEGDAVRPRFDASAASISECLNVTIEVNNMEGSAYMEALLTRPTTLQFGAVSYGMDYLDPANMLGLWVSTGRHSWRNAEFDALVTEANSLVGDPERRTDLYKQAERILVEDVGGIFLNHRIQGTLYQPYYKGAFREPNAQGVAGWQWWNQWVYGTVYISNDVMNYDTYRTR
jgi:peptide/nickel transport system substrate-binding protein/oligopeptide transport system substrate-binding protein